jgi:hypothetical protein
MRLTGDGPFTAFFSEDSPAKAGIWIGWRIVCRFMENNPKITPAQLMENQDFQSILSLSAYNP